MPHKQQQDRAYSEVALARQPYQLQGCPDLSFNGATTMELVMAYTFTKGEFGLFPAKLLAGLPPNKQVILAWLIFRMNQEGTCFPSVERLCADTGIKSRTTVTKCLKELEADGYVKAKQRKRDDGGSTSNEYRVFIRRQGGGQELDTNYTNTNQSKLTNPSQAPVAENEESRQSKPLSPEKKKRAVFRAPSVAEVAEYVAERVKVGKPFIDAEQFVDSYTAKGWLIGKTPVKDWKACVRTWQKNNFAQSSSPSPAGSDHGYTSEIR